MDVESPSGKVSWIGVDYGPHPVLVATPCRNNVPYVTVYVPGHKSWSSIGRQSYRPAQFHIFKVKAVILDDRGEHGPVRRIRLLVEALLDVHATQKTGFDLKMSIDTIRRQTSVLPAPPAPKQSSPTIAPMLSATPPRTRTRQETEEEEQRIGVTRCPFCGADGDCECAHDLGAGDFGDQP